MPIPVFNYAALPTQGNKFLEGLLPAIQAGLKLGYMPQNLNQDLKSKQLANALSQNELNYAPQMSQQKLQGLQLGNQNMQIQNQYLPRMDDAHLAQMAASTGLTNLQAKYLPQSEGLANALKQLQIQSLTQKNNDPLGGKFLPGDAGQIQALEKVKQAYGENSNIYKEIKSSYDANQELNKSKTGYYSERGMSPLAKLLYEQSNVAAGNNPAGIPFKNAPSGTPQDLSNIYGNLIASKTKPTFVYQKQDYANNVEKTLDSIDATDLTSNSGLFGLPNRVGGAVSSSLGFKNPQYNKYQVASQQAELLGHQVRQFYGDSIQPAMQKKINELTNPTSWLTSPELALQKFNVFKQTMRNELQTYRDDLESFKKNKPSSQSPQKADFTYDPSTGELK